MAALSEDTAVAKGSASKEGGRRKQRKYVFGHANIVLKHI
jgi:hypothetical protein